MKISMGMKKAAVIGIAGAMLFTWGISSVSASIVSTEKPMAGINVPLDRFVVAEVRDRCSSFYYRSGCSTEYCSCF